MEGLTMEFVIEFFFEFYLEMMFFIVPEENASKRHILIAKILAVCVLLVFLALMIWGLVLIVDDNNMWGIAPIAGATVLSVAQITAGMMSYRKHH